MEFTLLKIGQIYGHNTLGVIKKYGAKVAPTDLALILGAYQTGNENRTCEDDLTCRVWSASVDSYKYVLCVGTNGKKSIFLPSERKVAVRPVFCPSETSLIMQTIKTGIKGVKIGKYGEYPQTVADSKTSKKLEMLFQTESLKSTGKFYTFDGVELKDKQVGFHAISYKEYKKDDRKYIRVNGKPSDWNCELSTGERVQEEKPYWLEVQPVEWLVDSATGTWISKKCLFAGIQFDTKEDGSKNFSKMFINYYLNTFFIDEILPTDEYLKVKGLEKAQQTEILTIQKISEEPKTRKEIRSLIEAHKSEIEAHKKQVQMLEEKLHKITSAREALADKLREIRNEYDDPKEAKAIAARNKKVQDLRKKIGRE